MKNFFFIIALLGSIFFSFAQKEGFTERSWAAQEKTEGVFLKTVSFDRFKTHLKALTAKPHVVGSEANVAVRDYMKKTMADAGLDVILYPYDVYLPKEPGTSLIEIVTPKREPLNQQEDIIEGDPFSDAPGLWKGWNAFSGSGDVTAEIVYVNYGRKEDFEQLKALGVSIAGKIVIARYGGNFRGFKAKFAEANGAAGLIIFTDPEDSGYMKGLVYPDGPYYNDSTIQRGSLLTEDFTGDPLTPFEPALPLDGKKKIKRLDPKDTKMHTIPVSPIGYGAAKKILEQMQGAPVPVAWQGGLPFTYRLEGGSALKVRLKVNQKKDFVRVHDVVGTLRGSDFPDEWIILGCHFDAWAFGATDPNSGTSMLLNLSETLGKLAESGYRPKRSIMIGHWDAEEHGVIGSTEWVEQMRDALDAKAVAYLNFDGAVSGKNFGASAAPTLKKLMMDASKVVRYPYEDKSLYNFWKGAEKEEPSIGNLGGGSDHIGFYMHVGVPSLSGGAGGPNLYHSNYDSFHFYERFVDPEFKMGGMVTQVSGIMALRLANAEIIPYDIERYATDLKIHFKTAVEKIKKFNPLFDGFSLVDQRVEKLNSTATILAATLEKTLANATLSKSKIKEINRQMLALEKSFIDNKGMYFGSWYKSLYAASDPFSGYASWILPGLEYEIALKSSERLEEWDQRYSSAIQQLETKMMILNDYLAE